MQIILISLASILLSSCSTPLKTEKREFDIVKLGSSEYKVLMPTETEKKECLHRREQFHNQNDYSSFFKKTIKGFPFELKVKWAICNSIESLNSNYDIQGTSNLFYQSMTNLVALQLKPGRLNNYFSFYYFQENRLLTFETVISLPILPQLFSKKELSFFDANFIGYKYKLDTKREGMFHRLYLMHLQYYIYQANEFQRGVLNCENVTNTFLANRLLESALIVKLYLIRLKKFYPQKHSELYAQKDFPNYIKFLFDEADHLVSFFNKSVHTCTIKRKEFDLLYKDFINIETFMH